MPEGNMSSENSATKMHTRPMLNRRNLVKGFAGVAAGGFLSNKRSNNAEAQATPERHEQLVPSEISCLAIAGPRTMENGLLQLYSKEKTIETIERLTEALKGRPTDIVLTQEFSFMAEDEAIGLEQVGEAEWVLDDSSTPFIRGQAERLQQIAKENHCSIMGATFSEKGGDQNHATLLHINSEGKIVGIKRKNSSTDVSS